MTINKAKIVYAICVLTTKKGKLRKMIKLVCDSSVCEIKKSSWTNPQNIITEGKGGFIMDDIPKWAIQSSQSQWMPIWKNRKDAEKDLPVIEKTLGCKCALIETLEKQNSGSPESV